LESSDPYDRDAALNLLPNAESWVALMV
jgi:hypothetical protein